MKTLLISPKGSNFYAKLGLRIPPLGLAYVAAVIRSNGHQVKMIDLGLESRNKITDLIRWADIVGISADTANFPEALMLAKTVKKEQKIVVMGGYHVTFMDQEALSTGQVDFIVRGEGEYTYLNLLNALEKKADPGSIKGISYMHSGTFNRNQDSNPPEHLDDLPFPARDLLPIEKYESRMNGWSFTNLITSRGCPYNCYFCSSSRFGGLKWRARSARSIVDEIEFLVKTYGYKAFSIMDDNFTFIPERVFEFADELDKRGLNHLHWWCFSRVDILVRNETMIRRMAETGAYMIFLGLESNNEKILKRYNKHIQNDQQKQAIDLLKKYGIEIHASYILGELDETVEMAENTIRWAKGIQAKTCQFSILTPYPGTALYEQVRQENRFLHHKWDLFDGLHPVIRLNRITPKQMSSLLVKAYKKVYLNRTFLLNLIFQRTKRNRNLPPRSARERLLSFKKTVKILTLFLFKLKKFSSSPS